MEWSRQGKGTKRPVSACRDLHHRPAPLGDVASHPATSRPAGSRNGAFRAFKKSRTPLHEKTGKSKESADEAKARGTAALARNEIPEALKAYEEAEKHDPSDHVHPSNISFCHLELAKKAFEPAEKLEHTVRAFIAASRCVTLNPSWLKGHVRKSTAEAEVLSATTDFKKSKEERKTELDYEDKPWPEPEQALMATAESASYGSVESTCRAGLAIDQSNALLRLKLQELRDDGRINDAAADLILVDVEAAAPLKAEGNAAFAAKKYEVAAEKYTAALSFNPSDHIFYSNRSACYAGLAGEDDCKKALRDADACLRLSPSFAKGHSRRSAALFGLGRYIEAEAAAVAGLKLEPESAPLKELLATAQAETAETVEVQAAMHKMRQQRQRDERMKKMLSGLNLGGSNVMFNGMGGFGGNMGGMGGLEGLFGDGGGNNFMNNPVQTDAQMRMMARAMAQVEGQQAHDEGGGGNDQ